MRKKAKNGREKGRNAKKMKEAKGENATKQEKQAAKRNAKSKECK